MEKDGKNNNKKKVTTPGKNTEPLTKKQQLNNHIVLMRKAVKQVRVHLINKLTKEIKKLKVRKGDEKAQEKSKRKADRLLQEIQTIKHLKEDLISIYALQDKTKLEAVLQNSQSSIKDRAISRFSHHKLLQIQVLKYREENPHWELQIPVLLEKSKDKRRQINKKLAEREASKISRSSSSKNIALLDRSDEEGESLSSDEDDIQEESLTETEEDNEDKNLSSNFDEANQEEPLSSDLDEGQKSIIKPLSKSIEKAKDNVQVSKSLTKKVKVIPKNKNTSKITKTTKSTEQIIDKSEGTVRVQVLRDLEDLEKYRNSDITVKVQADDLTKIPQKLPKSSFFVGGEDEEPKFTQVEQTPRRRTQLPQNSTEFKPVFRKGKLINSSKGPNRFQQRGKSSQNSSRYFSQDTNLIPLGSKPQNKVETFRGAIKSTTPAAEEKLHPSWEAKKRQQTSLSTFQGKKIKFDY